MSLDKIVLLSASIGVGIIGLGYLISPQFMYSFHGIEIVSINQFNVVRGAYGGLFVTFSILFLIGVISSKFTLTSLTSLLTFMLGFAIGRIVSMFVDGTPSLIIHGLTVTELFYSVVCAYFIYSNPGKTP